MRNLFIALSAVCAMALLAVAGATDARAQNITGSSHDLTVQGGTGPDANQICVYCHTPHSNIITTNPPLWNRNNSTATFTMYASPSIDMTVATAPQGVSAGCLSCHDGVTALGNIIKGSVGLPAVMSGGAVIGTDLRNDHPISVTYDNVADPDFLATPGNDIPLFEDPATPGTFDQVECGSCHNPHDPGTIGAGTNPFLRVSVNASTLCLSCHQK